MARTDFRAAAARRLSEERELSPAIVSLLSPEHTAPQRRASASSRSTGSSPTRSSPRLAFDAGGARGARRVDPRARRPPADPRPAARRRTRYQLIAGERRWRASKLAGLATIPALVEDIDDDTALEIAIIENLQREDLSPLDEAAMYDRMVREHGYSIRKLAEKLGKDKGYLENRLRLADAPARDPRAGVFAQRHPVPRLRADEGRGPARSASGSPTRSPAASCRWSSSARRSRAGRPRRRRGRRTLDGVERSATRRAEPARRSEGWTADHRRRRAAPRRLARQRQAAAHRGRRGARSTSSATPRSCRPSARSTGPTSRST